MIELRRVADAEWDGLQVMASFVDADGTWWVGCAAEEDAVDGRPYPLALFRLGLSGWERVLDLMTAHPQPRITLLQDGSVLVAGGFCERRADGSVEANTTVYSSSGVPLREFALGDGIADIQAGPDEHVWVTYSNPGTMGDYGARGWGRLGPEEWIDPMGLTGLVCFDSQGRRRYAYAPPPETEVIGDGYALNVEDEHAWVCFHPGFPIVRTSTDGKSVAWKSCFPPVDSVLVAGSRFLAHSGFGSQNCVCRIGRLGDREVTGVEVHQLSLPDGVTPDPGARFSSRGQTLAMIDAHGCYRFDLEADGA